VLKYLGFFVVMLTL